MQLQFIAGSVISDGGVSLKKNDNVKESVYYIQLQTFVMIVVIFLTVYHLFFFCLAGKSIMNTCHIATVGNPYRSFCDLDPKAIYCYALATHMISHWFTRIIFKMNTIWKSWSKAWKSAWRLARRRLYSVSGRPSTTNLSLDANTWNCGQTTIGAVFCDIIRQRYFIKPALAKWVTVPTWMQ